MPTRRDRPYRAVVAAAGFLFRVLGLRVEVRGAEHLPATGPVVVAANHQSFADFAVVGLPAVQRGRLVRFLAKEAVFRAPVAGWLMRAMGHVPVDRRAGAAAAVRALRLLRAGEVVGGGCTGSSPSGAGSRCGADGGSASSSASRWYPGRGRVSRS